MIRIVPFILAAVIAAPATRSSSDVNDLYLEIVAHRSLAVFKLPPAGLTELKALADKVGAKSESKSVPEVSEAFMTTLTDLRAAYIKGDETRIDALEAQLDKLLDEEDAPELDDDVPVKDAAREKAADAVKLLRPAAVVNYLAGRDEIPDALTLVQNALYITVAPSKRPQGADWESEKRAVAEQVGWLVMGVRDSAAAAKVTKDVTQLLDEAYKLDAATRRTQRGALTTKAKKIISHADPLIQLRHVLEYDMAELLSNPRLSAACEARMPPQKQPKKK
jgi:hypothetical protein